MEFDGAFIGAGADAVLVRELLQAILLNDALAGDPPLNQPIETE